MPVLALGRTMASKSSTGRRRRPKAPLCVLRNALAGVIGAAQIVADGLAGSG
jgi:hypothetical protein